MLSRRQMLTMGAAGIAVAALPVAARAQLTVEEVQFDPKIPALGNPEGDVSIAEYFDYQCPYCKRGHKELLDVVREDGKVRLVMKDWPIFGGASLYAASLVLAAGNDYERALNAVMATPARLSNADVDAALASEGLDPKTLQATLEKDTARIDGILDRNMNQANILGLNGTPAFVIGNRVYAGALDAARLRDAIALARKG